jgi:IS30 family transposase
MAPHSDKAKIVRFTDSVKHDVEEGFRSTYSPEQIAGRAVLERRDMVSHERICQHIWQDKKQGGELHEYLRTKGKHYRKREVR